MVRRACRAGSCRAWGGVPAAVAASVASTALPDSAAAEALPVEPWMKLPGSGFVGYGQPSKYEEKVARTYPPSKTYGDEGVRSPPPCQHRGRDRTYNFATSTKKAVLRFIEARLRCDGT